jgi:hypothetical protein
MFEKPLMPKQNNFMASDQSKSPGHSSQRTIQPQDVKMQAQALSKQKSTASHKTIDPVAPGSSYHTAKTLHGSQSSKQIANQKFEHTAPLKQNPQRYSSQTATLHLANSEKVLWYLSQNQFFGGKSKEKEAPQKTPAKKLEQLLNHSSDSTVKPIVGNKDIEIVPPSP